VRAEDEDERARAYARFYQECAEARGGEQHRRGVENGGIDADRSHEDPVAEDLGDHRQQDEAGHAGSLAGIVEDAESAPPAAQPPTQRNPAQS
jgi:hypothetical protein